MIQKYRIVPRFDVHAFEDLASLFDSPGYAGYKPAVREAPNGDAAVDTGKRYLHVARKYNPPAWAEAYLALAHFQACKIAERIGVPDAFMPRTEDSTLRVLEYPSAAHRMSIWDQTDGCDACGRANWGEDDGKIVPGELCPALAAGAGTAEHTDSDLFTVNLWRSTPEDHEAQNQVVWTRGAPAWHLGEIGELVGLGRAVPHRVPARPYTQRALVYFAIPSHGSELPRQYSDRAASGVLTVGEWLQERMARSRVYR